MSERDVVIYSTPFCVPCEQLKRYLDAHGVSFTTRDLMMDEERPTPWMWCDGGMMQRVAPIFARIWAIKHGKAPADVLEAP